MKSILATRYIDKTIAGLCEPCLLEGIDRNKYVVKFKNNRVSIKVLTNDFISCKLAEKLGLSVPKVEIIHVCQDLIDMEPMLQIPKVTVGNHFGSLYYKDVSTFFGEEMLRQASNLEEISKIVAFDLWVGNDDRCNNGGNLLLDTVNGKLLSIDNGNAFNGPDWIKDDLEIYQVSIPDFEGEVYSTLRKFIEGKSPFDDICKKIESLTFQDIESCTQGIPDDWELDESSRVQICKFLDGRKKDVRLALESIKEKFPKWRR